MTLEHKVHVLTIVLLACCAVKAQTSFQACIPVAEMNVPIQVRVDGQGDLCPSREGASNDLTRFTAAEIVRQYTELMSCSGCELSGVQLASCSSRPTGRQARTLLTYTANITCSDGCRRAQPRDKDTLQAYQDQLTILRSAIREKPQVGVEYVPGYTVTLLYFRGRKSEVVTKCNNTEVAYNIRNALAVCLCHASCPDVCDLARDVGPCLAAIPRYFYNQTSSACEQFRYGGCAGNDNNFVSLQACQQQCSQTRS